MASDASNAEVCPQAQVISAPLAATHTEPDKNISMVPVTAELGPSEAATQLAEVSSSTILPPAVPSKMGDVTVKDWEWLGMMLNTL